MLTFKDNKKHYNGERLYNNLAPFKFSYGSRSSGKTYWYKREALREFINNKSKFIYMRRYLNEIDVIKDNFFNDIEHNDIGKNTKVSGYDIYYKDSHCGMFMSLAQYNKYKSKNLSEYNLIIFDEVLPEDEKYLHKSNYAYEPQACLNFYQTVARGFNKPIREEVKFVFISNALKTFNPFSYYFKYDVLLTQNAKFIERDFYVVENFANKLVNEEIKKTKFGRFISQVEYGNYALNNEFLLDNKSLIINNKDYHKKNAYVSIVFNNKIFTFFVQGNNRLVLTEDKTTNQKYLFSVMSGCNEPLLQASSSFKIIKKYYLQGLIKATNQETVTLLKLICE